MNVPINIELVFEDFIKDCLDNSEPLGFTKTEVYLGNQTILILDEEKSNVLYCCSLVQNEGDNFNFCVKVEYILFFNNKDALFDQLDEITSLGGLNNYLTKINIDINQKEEQDIRDNKGRIVGKFLKFQKKNSNDI